MEPFFYFSFGVLFLGKFLLIFHAVKKNWKWIFGLAFFPVFYIYAIGNFKEAWKSVLIFLL
jgi:hypothetical protein